MSEVTSFHCSLGGQILPDRTNSTELTGFGSLTDEVLHGHTHARARTHTQAHTHKHTHTHTHTRTQARTRKEMVGFESETFQGLHAGG